MDLKDNRGIPFRFIGDQPTYDTRGAAEYTGLQPNTIRNLVYTGQLSMLKMGRSNRYYKSYLDELIQKRVRKAIY